MKKIIGLILLYLLILTSTLFSQIIPKVTITGKVTDKSTNRPIENVDVFLSFTTRGDITDHNGIFTIENVPVGVYNLVVSMIGYEIIKQDIQLTKASNKTFNFRLKQKMIKAPEIEVQATHAYEWQKNYKTFKKIFLGTSGNAAKCKILNPEYLEFNYSKISNNLTAYSKRPIQVRNEALGYQISFNLLDFLSDGYFDTKFMVTAKFSPLSPENGKEMERWKKNRNKAYKGSMRHFFTALAAGTLTKEDFEVYQTSNVSPGRESTYYQKLKINETVTTGNSAYERRLSFDKYLKIIYNGEYESLEYAHYVQSVKNYQISWIELTQDAVTFNTSGMLYEPYSVLTHGYWAWERAAEMLPLDYKPEAE